VFQAEMDIVRVHPRVGLGWVGRPTFDDYKRSGLSNLFIHIIKHQRQRVQVIYIPVESSTMNVCMLETMKQDRTISML